MYVVHVLQDTAIKISSDNAVACEAKLSQQVVPNRQAIVQTLHSDSVEGFSIWGKYFGTSAVAIVMGVLIQWTSRCEKFLGLPKEGEME